MKITVHKCRSVEYMFPVIAWLIMIFQGMWPWSKESFSHLVIEYNGKFYDVSFAGFRETEKNTFFSRYAIVDSHTLKRRIPYEAFNKWIEPFYSIEYDYLQILGLLLKSLKLVKVNKIGDDLNSMVCNELPLHYVITFCNFIAGDTDNYDLHSTWRVIKGY